MKNILKTILTIIVLVPSVYAYPQNFEEKNKAKADDAAVVEEKKSEPETAKKKYRGAEIVITATKTEIAKEETGASITVIDGKKIEESDKNNVSEILRNVTGITVAKTSPFGGQTSIGIRGAHQGNVLVLIDGVPLNDPASPDRDFDFANLAAESIDRIEVIRGPASVLYGSDAAGGVINIITKKGAGNPKALLSAEGGSYCTFSENALFLGGNDIYDYMFSLGRTDSRGFPKSAESSSNPRPEKDGYENTAFSSRVGTRLFETGSIDFSIRYGSAAYDIPAGAFKDAKNNKFYQELLTASFSFDQTPVSFWEHRLILAYSGTIHRNIDNSTGTVSNGWYEGNLKKFEWRNNFSIGEFDVITAGMDADLESGAQAGTWGNTEEKTIYSYGYYLQNHLKLFKRFFFIAGARLDDNEFYGYDLNYSLSLSIVLPVVNTRLKGNYATGFKAPTIYQLYDPFSGNKELKPEKNASWDIGFEQELFNKKVMVAASYFNSIYRNMINWTYKGPGPFDGNYLNEGRVEIHGWEAEAEIRPFDALSFNGNYTYALSKNTFTGEELLRRPRHSASAGANLHFLNDKANINLSYMFIGRRKDIDPETYLPVEIAAYYRLDIAAFYRITEQFSITGRIENLTNNNYQEVLGYATPGISFYGGIKAIL